MKLSSIWLLFVFAGVALATESDYLKLKPEMFGGYFYKLVSDRTVEEYLFGTNGYVTVILGDKEAVACRWSYWTIEGEKTLLVFQKTNSPYRLSHVFQSMTETNAVTVKGLRFTRKRATIFEGTYTTGAPDLSGSVLTLKNGTFTNDSWSDVGPPFGDKATGTYIVEGNRITLSGTRPSDKEKFTTVWYAYTIDGIPILLAAMGDRLLPGFSFRSDVLPKGPKGVVWPELFRQHPNLPNLSNYLGSSYTTPEELNELIRERNIH